MVQELKLTSQIEEFANVLARFMPKYNELKHFNAKRIVDAFQSSTREQRRIAQLAEESGPLNLTWTFDGAAKGGH